LTCRPPGVLRRGPDGARSGNHDDIHRDDYGTLRRVGFATFTENFTKGDSRWFANLIFDLKSGDAARSERFARLQFLLANLVRQLDDEGRYSRLDASGQRSEPEWMTPASTGVGAASTDNAHNDQSRWND
jgi:hypothetical protein